MVVAIALTLVGPLLLSAALVTALHVTLDSYWLYAPLGLTVAGFIVSYFAGFHVRDTVCSEQCGWRDALDTDDRGPWWLTEPEEVGA